LNSDNKSSYKKKIPKQKEPVASRVSIKPSTLLAPVPIVMVSCQGKPDGKRPLPNILTVAWAGTVCSDPPMLGISIRKERWSYEQIKETREFVINLVTKDLLHSADYCGVKSGAEIDKFSACKLTPVKAEGMNLAPSIAESPLTLSCRVSQIIQLGTHDLFLAKIVGVEVDSTIMKGKKICLENAGLIAYAHGEYFELGSVLGFFGYSIASAEVLKRRMPAAKNEKPLKVRGELRKSGPGAGSSKSNYLSKNNYSAKNSYSTKNKSKK
jgi:flavin reductase (DIM6/NTAB) family NADH-FMN oxidoreductase RutF